MDAALDTFIAEAQELTHAMEQGLLRVGEGGCTPDLLNDIFRSAHTIKGSAGLFGFDEIVEFTHHLENVLDRARDGEIDIDGNLLPILLKCYDHISVLITLVIDNKAFSGEVLAAGKQLVENLGPWLEQANSQTTVASASKKDEGMDGIWHISVKMGIDALKNGMDPISIIRYLGTLGEIEYVAVVDDSLPLEDFNPENLYIGFEIGLRSDRAKSEIDDAFMFVREDSEIKLIPPNSSVEKYIDVIRASARGEERIGEILVRCGAITEAELSQALSQQTTLSTTSGKPPIGEILLSNEATSEKVITAALESQLGRRPTRSRHIRIDADRLDKLINLIGETIINHQRIDLISSRIGNLDLEEVVSEIKGLTEQVRDAALVLRMVPIGETFQKFRRVVRDVATSLHKDIKLTLSGEETELDRSMVEKISDPLTHIVRNAIDHGIESRDLRRKRNKPTQGNLFIAAEHDSGNIVITIADDGGGLNTQKIRTKALAAGLLSENSDLTDHEIHQLIFHPGLTTAETVTDLSGRGVGMDVVKRNIEELQGNVSIVSKEGEGTTITIRLPLTLAIIDGFHVSAEGTDFIIPHAAIVECLDFGSVKTVEGSSNINLRGDLVPYLELREIFALKNTNDARKKILVVRFGEQQAGILVDELYGELQTVVKPLNPIFNKLKGIGGSTLLGSGDIAFILDIPKLIDFAVRKESQLTH